MRLLRSGYLVLVALVLWSVTYLIALLIFAISHNLTFVGSDGTLPADQLQYLAWIRDSGNHVLVSNLFDLAPSHHVFLHPMFLLSGVAWTLGMNLQLSYLLWKPVAVAVIFAGFAAYVRRTIEPSGWPRQVALVTAIFFFTPTFLVIRATDLGGDRASSDIGGLAREMFTAGSLWGYLPAAAAIGLMPLFLLAIERILEPERRASGRRARWYLGWASAAGLFTSWLHPWQGLTLLVIVAGLVAWGRFRRRYFILGIPALAVAGPLVYYLTLSRADHAWKVAAKQNQFPDLSLWVVIAGLAPIALFAIIGAARRSVQVQDRILRLWPLASLAVYFKLSPSFQFHAFGGLSLPLAVLAVQGWRRLGLGAAPGAAAVAAAVVPALLWGLNGLNNVAKGDRPLHATALAHTITRDEARALHYLADSPRPGGVLAPARIGSAVPALSGRRTWVGHPVWTPAFTRRWREAEALFDGRMSETEARLMVREVGARFLLSDCRGRRLARTLEPILASVRHFGCVSVYEVRDQ